MGIDGRTAFIKRSPRLMIELVEIVPMAGSEPATF
jgi:hypothetical protein